MMKTRTGLELTLIDFLVKKDQSLYNVNSLQNIFNVKKEDLKETLNNLEKEKIIAFEDGNNFKINQIFFEKVSKFKEIINLIEKLPEFKCEFDYFNSPRITIITPFRLSSLDRLTFQVTKENQNLFIQKSSFELSFYGFEEELTEEYLKELNWRFNIDTGFEKVNLNGKSFRVMYFKKQTSVESFIKHLYTMINAFLFIEGLIMKKETKPVSKETLISTIVGLVGQGIYCGYVNLAFQGEFPKTEEDIDKEIAKEEERLTKELESKTEEQLWQILEKKAREIIPINTEGNVDSHAYSAYKKALMLLAKKGKFKVSYKDGRRVIGKFTEELKDENNGKN